MTSTMVQLEIKNATFSAAIGEDADPLTLTEFADHIDNAALTTTSTPAKFAAISGNDQNSIGKPAETIVLNIGQDLTAGSLWMFLRTNHGKKGTVKFGPQGGAGTGECLANVTFAAPATLGGAVGGGVSAATLQVNGQATITPANAA